MPTDAQSRASGPPGWPAPPTEGAGRRTHHAPMCLVGDAFTRVIAISGHYPPNPILSLLPSLQIRRQVSTPVAGDLRVPRGVPI